MPGGVTQRQALGSAEHIRVARGSSPGKPAHLPQRGVGQTLLAWQAEGASFGKLPHLSLAMELSLSPRSRHQPLPLASGSGGALGMLLVGDETISLVLGVVIFGI